MHLAQHLVLHLDQVARIEEATGLKPSGAHPLWVGVEGAELLEALDLGVVLGHGWNRHEKYVILTTPLLPSCQGAE